MRISDWSSDVCSSDLQAEPLCTAAREIGNRLASARRGDEQNRWLYVAGVCGVALGLFLYALLAGPIARWTPDSWRWPERMAVRVLDESGTWAAGQRLMQADDRSEEHTSELKSLISISYADFSSKKKTYLI